MNIFVTKVAPSIASQLKADLEQQGFSLAQPQYTIFQAKKKGITCTLYESGKLTVQGKNMREFLEFYLEPEILKSPLYTYKDELALHNLDTRPRIGVDEAGKGDYFGPLCVAGVFADEKLLPELIKLGVRDSKTLSDDQVRKIAAAIVKSVPNYVIRLQPKKYNELYASFKNLNTLLAWCHTTVIEQLASHCHASLAIVDKFAHERVIEAALRKKKMLLTVEQRVRGEQDVVVAAASIVARWAFLDGLESLGKRIGVDLPKGASRHVVAKAKSLVRERGPEILQEVAKTHFKTTQEVLPSSGE